MSTSRYVAPAVVPGALRLHLNENTRGCSPAVLKAVATVGADQIAQYPDYRALTSACCAYLGVEDASRVALVSGLDEGLLAAVVASFRADERPSGVPEGIIVVPAFEMYAIQIRAVGGTVVEVPMRPGFEVPVDDVLAAVTPRTRILFLTNPNNPTGVVIPLDDLARLAEGVSPEVTVLLDEAYFEFSGVTFLPRLPEHGNVILGRTFAKAHGLAGLRAGCLIGAADRLDAIRDVLPPFSISVLSAAGWLAALQDTAYVAEYVAEVESSKRLVYATCDRLRLPYWKSAGNFVLIRVGERATALTTALATRGILISDRSGQPGCGGCVRMTAGPVEDTRTALTALEEYLCAEG